ncbi:MAG TPA: lipopolysaccharide assembly protein LapA domain-containing protein [Ferrovibrio sp.]|uniref:lipopolysaccharide assembly protein LapA domain-containing protein n=1 Tax=Ferrovibrio sp. TaxID=1917215 RepID=UPI002ED22C33
MRFVRVLIGALLLIILIIFAVANRQTVGVSLDPLPFILELPLYLLVFLVLFAGLLVGALAGRFSGLGAARRRERLLRAKAQEAKAQDAKIQQAQIQAMQNRGGPAPPAPIV